MKLQYTLGFFIKSLVLFAWATSSVMSQEHTKAMDTLKYKQKYGLRLGADLSKLARSFVDDTYRGVEIIGDYRLTKRIYLAGELGNEERTIENEVLSNTTSGSYFKAGADINLYRNWLDMQNMIFTGFRVGASTFSQTLNNYSIYNTNNQYWNQQFLINDRQEFNGLAAVWTEIILGLKAEFLTNFFIGLNVQLKFLLSETEPENFENLYIPGFNRTYDSNRFGSGFGLTMSYLIPIFKKDKIVIQEKPKE